MTTDWPSDFRAWLRSRGWTQEEAAVALGVRLNAVCAWCNGRNLPDRRSRLAIERLGGPVPPRGDGGKNEKRA